MAKIDYTNYIIHLDENEIRELDTTNQVNLEVFGEDDDLLTIYLDRFAGTVEDLVLGEGIVYDQWTIRY
jgi:hypothetical protein